MRGSRFGMRHKEPPTRSRLVTHTFRYVVGVLAGRELAADDRVAILTWQRIAVSGGGHHHRVGSGGAAPKTASFSQVPSRPTSPVSFADVVWKVARESGTCPFASGAGSPRTGGTVSEVRLPQPPPPHAQLTHMCTPITTTYFPLVGREAAWAAHHELLA
jgi:hypothetical protein